MLENFFCRIILETSQKFTTGNMELGRVKLTRAGK
jgi:hypothetical protein